MSLPATEAFGWELLPVIVVLVGLPALDTALVIVSRRRRSALVLAARDHLTHRLFERLGSCRHVAPAVAGAQAALGTGDRPLLYLDPNAAAAGAATPRFRGVDCGPGGTRVGILDDQGSGPCVPGGGTHGYRVASSGRIARVRQTSDLGYSRGDRISRASSTRSPCCGALGAATSWLKIAHAFLSGLWGRVLDRGGIPRFVPEEIRDDSAAQASEAAVKSETAASFAYEWARFGATRPSGAATSSTTCSRIPRSSSAASPSRCRHRFRAPCACRLGARCSGCGR